MTIVPISIREASAFVKERHRHNLPPVGGKFAIAAEHDGKRLGVAIAGRPVARLLDDGTTLEVIRVCTDGTRNGNSFLYGAVRRIALAMGYKRLITYTLQEESGSSLRAIGAQSSEVRGGTWSRASRQRIEQDIFGKAKIRWTIPLT